MAVKINPKASRLIDEAFAKMPSPWREICEKLRAIVHKADPEIIEDWKWGPNFNKNGMVCNVWAFKAHAALVFFRGAEMKDPEKLFNYGEDNKSSRMIKFTDIRQVKEKELIPYIREAARLNETAPKKPAKPVKEMPVPPDLEAWFGKNKKAKTFFEKLPYTYRKEMLQLLKSARREETRVRRFKAVTDALKKGQRAVR